MVDGGGVHRRWNAFIFRFEPYFFQCDYFASCLISLLNDTICVDPYVYARYLICRLVNDTIRTCVLNTPQCIRTVSY